MKFKITDTWTGKVYEGNKMKEIKEETGITSFNYKRYIIERPLFGKLKNFFYRDCKVEFFKETREICNITLTQRIDASISLNYREMYCGLRGVLDSSYGKTNYIISIDENDRVVWNKAPVQNVKMFISARMNDNDTVEQQEMTIKDTIDKINDYLTEYYDKDRDKHRD